MGNSSSKEEVINAEQLKKIEDQIEKDDDGRKKLLMDVEASLKQDGSVVNIVINYAKIRAASPSKLNCIGACVKEMKDGWSKIMEQLKTIEKYGETGKEKSKTMKSIYYEYWELLLQTKNKLYLLSKETKFQKNNISNLLKNIEKAHNNEGPLPDDQRQAFQESINTLGQWIKTDDICTLITKWREMAQKLEDQKSDWETLAQKAGAYYRKKTKGMIGNLILGTIVVLGIIAGIAALTIATAGIGTAVAAAGAAATIATHTTAISTAAVVATAVSVGGAVTVGSTLYGICQAYKFKKQSQKIQDDINNIITKLENMLRVSKHMSSKLNDVDASKQAIDQTLKNVKDYKSFENMKYALNSLAESLDEFDEKNKEATEQIGAAVKEFLDQK